MPPSCALIQVPFDGDVIDCVRSEETRQAHVVIRRVCENLGVSFATQLRKLQIAPWATVVMMTTVGNDGKSREMACISIDDLPTWLVTINTNKIPNPRLRTRLQLYQREARQVLRDYFLGGSNATVAPASLAAQTAELTLRALTPLLTSVMTAVVTTAMPALLEPLERRLSALEGRSSVAPEPDEAAYIDENRKKELRGLIYQAKQATCSTFPAIRDRLFGHFNVTEYGRLRNREFAAARQFLFDILDQARQPATPPEARTPQVWDPSTHKGEIVDTPTSLREWRSEFGAHFGMRQLEELAAQLRFHVHQDPGTTPKGHLSSFRREDFEEMKVYQRRMFRGTSASN